MRIAVTGATGNIGSQVVRLLAAEQDHEVVALSRSGTAYAEAHDPELKRVTDARADYGDPEALRSALRGTDTLVLISSDGEGARVLVHHHNVIRAARDNGVSHIVVLSGLDADTASPFCYALTNGYTEEALRAGDFRVSIARASLFSEFFLGFLPPRPDGGGSGAGTGTGRLELPAADGRISLVSRADVGRCLAALAVSAPTDRHHDLTGPESLDLPTIAALTEQVRGAPLTYADVSPSDYWVELARSGEEPWWCYAYSTMFDSIREQRWAPVTDEVARLTGREPLAFRDVLEERHRSGR